MKNPFSNRIDKYLNKHGYEKSIVPVDKWWKLDKSTRAWPTDGVYTNSRHVMGVIRPMYNPVVLVNAVETVSTLQTVISKIINEVVKNGYDFEEKFVKKCLECKTEYDSDQEECECGSLLLHAPDRSQLTRIKKLFDHPNSDDDGYIVKTFIDILKECVYYNKSLDDFYLEIVPAPDNTPVEIWSLPAEDIRIFGDVTVKRFDGSSEQTFCKVCYSSKKFFLMDKFYDNDLKNCPDCNRPLDITAYVQLARGSENIIARWAADEIIHGNSRAFGNRMYGNPPVLAHLNAAMVLNWMEIYQRDAYSLNKSPDGILTFPGWDTEELIEMRDKLNEYKRANPADKTTLWLPTQEPAVWINTMPKLVDMDAVQMAMFFREQIAIGYGVSLNMLGVQTPGKLGQETETVEVSYGTIEETQAQISEVINTRLMVRYPEIRDWKFVMNPPKKDDEMRKAELVSVHASTVATLRSSGIDAIMSDNMEVAIRGEQEPPSEPQASPFGGFQMSKSLTPRDIAPADAVARIRELENGFVSNMTDKYLEGTKDIVKMARVKGMTEVQLQGELEAFTEKFMEDAMREAKLFSQDAYELGMNEELNLMGIERAERFTQIDENALSLLSEQPHSVFNSIKTFGEDNVSQFRDIITNAYSTPGEFDLDKMVKNMEEATGGSISKLERIARSETTKITNMGRSEQWKQYADPEKREYYWSIARDNRVSALCRAIANGGIAELWGNKKVFRGNPYTLSELEHFTAGGLPHPNCRSTMIRKPFGGGSQKIPLSEVRE